MVTLEVSHDTSECAATWGYCLVALATYRNSINALSLSLSRAAAGFGLAEGPLPLRCLRMTAKGRQQELARFFPGQCVAAMEQKQEEL